MRLRLCALVFLLSASTLHAATVRGKITHAGQAKPGVKVTVNGGKSGRTSPVYSGSDGLFAIRGVPSGNCVLEVWPNDNGQPQTFRINVKEPFTDVFPIVVP